MTDKTNPCLTMGMVQVWSDEKFTEDDATKILGMTVDASKPEAATIFTADQFLVDTTTGKACIDSKMGKAFSDKAITALRGPGYGFFKSACPISQAKCDAMAEAIEAEQGLSFGEKAWDSLINGTGFALGGLIAYGLVKLFKRTPPGGGAPTGGGGGKTPETPTAPEPLGHAFSVEVPVVLVGAVAVKAAPTFLETVGMALGGLGEGALNFASGVPFILVPDGYFEEMPSDHIAMPQMEVY